MRCNLAIKEALRPRVLKREDFGPKIRGFPGFTPAQAVIDTFADDIMHGADGIRTLRQRVQLSSLPTSSPYAFLSSVPMQQIIASAATECSARLAAQDVNSLFSMPISLRNAGCVRDLQNPRFTPKGGG